MDPEDPNLSDFTIKWLILRKIGNYKDVAIKFKEYFDKTATLDHFSTGENHGLSIDQIWDKFIEKYGDCK